MQTKYQLWIKQGDKRVWLPVNPESIQLSNGSENKKIDIEGLGKTTIIRSPALMSFSFTVELPKNYYFACNYKNLTEPFRYFETLNQMKKDGPVRFLATNTPFNLACTIEKLGLSESAGDVGTLHCTITLVEYRKARTKKIEVVNNIAKLSTSSKKGREDTRIKPEIYTVKDGDYLIKISKKILGNTGRWREIYNLNKSVIGTNPNLIYTGQVLKMPI